MLSELPSSGTGISPRRNLQKMRSVGRRWRSLFLSLLPASLVPWAASAPPAGEAGISRTLFYRWQRRLERYSADGLHPRRWHARPGPEAAPPVERRILALAVAEATWGCERLAASCRRLWGLRVAPSTVQRLLRHHGLVTRRARLLVLKHPRGLAGPAGPHRPGQRVPGGLRRRLSGPRHRSSTGPCRLLGSLMPHSGMGAVSTPTRPLTA